MAMPGAVQFISGTGDFRKEDTAKLLASSGLDLHQSGFLKVSTIGPQGSGKSTLSNAMFGCNFRTRQARQVITRDDLKTTSGVSFAIAQSDKAMHGRLTLVFDTEGSDSCARKENHNFSDQLYVLSLTISDVLILNVWESSLGLQSTSVQAQLGPIFLAHKRLFGVREGYGKKRIIIVVRAQNDLGFTETAIQNMVKEDIDATWKELGNNKSLKDQFDIDVVGLSSIEGKGDAAELVQKLKELCYKTVPSGMKLPLEAFPSTVDEIWKTIKSDKDLNLPGIQVLVSEFHCQRFREEQLQEFQSAWGPLKAPETRPHDFKEKALKLLKSHLNKYKQQAEPYDAAVRERHLALLEAALQQHWADFLKQRSAELSKKVPQVFLAQLEPSAMSLQRAAWYAATATLKTDSLTKFRSEMQDLLQTYDAPSFDMNASADEFEQMLVERMASAEKCYEMEQKHIKEEQQRKHERTIAICKAVADGCQAAANAMFLGLRFRGRMD